MPPKPLVYRPSPNEPLNQTVVRAVADATETDPLDLTDRVYDCVDPDALDRLFAPVADGTPRTGAVVFTMAGCRVVVESTRKVLVTPGAEPTISESTYWD